MKIILFLSFLLFIFYCIESSNSTGIYITFRNDGLSNTFNQITNKIMTTVNNDRSIPPVSGQNSQVSYTFSDWQFDIFLQTPDTSSASTNELNFEWVFFQFSFQWNYHMDAKRFFIFP